MKNFLSIGSLALAALTTVEMASAQTMGAAQAMGGAVAFVQGGWVNLSSNSRSESFFIVGQNNPMKFSSNSFIGGLGLKYGMAVSDNVILSPKVFANMDGAKGSKTTSIVQTVNTPKIELSRTFELGVGGQAQYLINPMTAVGVDVSALYAQFKTKFSGSGINSFPDNNTTQGKFGFGFGANIERALTTDGRWRAGLAVAHHMYPTFKTKNFGPSAINTYNVKHTPRFTTVMLQLGVKLG